MRAPHAIGLVALSACSSGPAHLDLPAFPSSIESWLFGKRSSSGLVEVFAADRGRPAVRFDEELSPVRLEVRGFGETTRRCRCSMRFASRRIRLVTG